MGLKTLLGGKKDTSRPEKNAALQKDTLTGLPNRYYFKENFGEHGLFNTVRYKSVVVFDIDGFMEAQDSMNGDELILMVIEIAHRDFGERGRIFRWGGDKFTVLMEWSMEFATELCKEFCEEVSREGRVTVSVGLTEVRLNEEIKKHYYRAMQGCYLVKEMGGNGVKTI